ncbi:Rec8 like protein-domain-containing protein [Aspergillus bertholletiae]|uniref:Rec8 like protein-domain-containing protein n=1 Tax=Aspergillus bertholletiae TaxID=1226010 RepID=A0A5N7B9L7_9EURO|nr:Rec8 like protein-domain-containing protein [Aspergillus bertholletiae]
MFYSHEMLTSPDHGVATIWLIATLGSKSISKKLSRKAILDVDVPRACHVIMDPEAPMALRLQGNLLYGVSRVYSQQCGYALTDVQAMHDKMRTVLKVLPGGGLDPAAGKARPDQLILPYDPSFLPECDLPGMRMDFSKLSLPCDIAISQDSDFVRPNTPDLSQSALSQSPGLRFSFSYNDIIIKDADGNGPETNVSSSVQRNINLGDLAATTFAEEGGILLQPDFEFDEDGNLIELGEMHRQTAKGKMSRLASEVPLLDEAANVGLDDLLFDHQPMSIDKRVETTTKHQVEGLIHASRATKRRRSESESTDELRHFPDDAVATMPQKRRAPRLQILDDRTTLRNTDLGNLNNDYVQNMAIASKQKQQSKLLAQAKKNAAFWVWGEGIGSVGLGLGASRVPHPLQHYSGEKLYDILNQTARNNGHKQKKLPSNNGEADSDTVARHIRAREGYEEQVGRGGVVDNHDMWQEVEIGRHGPSIFRDDNSFSSQMPWNITASVQSSQHGSSAAGGLRGIVNVSDPSASRGREPTTSHLAGCGLSQNRLTSASPLAGKGFPLDAETFDSLTLPGNDDMDALSDFDLSQYLQTEIFGADHGDTGYDANKSTYGRQPTLQDRISKFSLDQESLNFLGFLTRKLGVMPVEYVRETDENGFNSPLYFHGSKAIGFSALLPPTETSCSVATQGLMHILTLATNGFLSVHQETFEDRSTQYRAKYEFGEILLQLSEV